MITFDLPWPDSRLMPNRKHGLHWTATHKIKSKAFNDSYIKIKSLGVCNDIGNSKKSLKIVFNAPDKRKRDLDNLLASMKPYIDGIAHALGIDDSLFCPITIDLALDPEKKGFVTITIVEDGSLLHFKRTTTGRTSHWFIARKEATAEILAEYEKQGK